MNECHGEDEFHWSSAMSHDERLLLKLLDDQSHVSRKQSASDLQSRLKTRKLLGVGELGGDIGDVYKSKISQLLGINESLYVRLPRGMLYWNTFSTVYYYICGAMCLGLPHIGIYLDMGITTKIPESLFFVRLYGAALLCFGFMFRSILMKRETRSDLASILLVSAMLHSMQVAVSAINGTVNAHCAILHTVCVLGNIFYHSLVDGQGGLHRQFLRIIEDFSLMTCTPIVEKKPIVDATSQKTEDKKTN